MYNLGDAIEKRGIAIARASAKEEARKNVWKKAEEKEGLKQPSCTTGKVG